MGKISKPLNYYNNYEKKAAPEEKTYVNEDSTRPIISTGVTISIIALLISVFFAFALWNYDGSFSLYGISIPVYPYRPYASIFRIAAFILLAGLIFYLAYNHRPKEIRIIQNVAYDAQPRRTGLSQIKCGTCGTMNDIDAVYCKKGVNPFR